MRLERLEVRDLRTVVGDPLTIELGRAATVLVGPNLSGKSNLARALLLALDADRDLDPERDLPRGHDDPQPLVRMTFATREHGEGRHRVFEVDWPDGVRRATPRQLTAGAVVVADATRTATEILAAVRPHLDGEDPVALSRDLLPTLQRVLPEIDTLEVDLDPPAVTAVDRSGFPVADVVVRATFGAALAAHLVRQGIDLTVVVVEEPESFLHPAAQESLRDELVEVAVAADAPVLLTTSSPFVVPRTAECRIIALARDDRGRTGVVGEARGDEAQARLLGGLFRDTGLAMVLDRAAAVPAGIEGVVVVEGGTDKAYLELAADLLGRRDELDRLAVHVGGGALPAALHAIVMRAETDVPVFVLLDNDDPGQTARRTLIGRFDFVNRREVTTYAEVLPDHPDGAEAEDLFDWRLVARFVEERGERAIRGKRILTEDHWHFDLVTEAKSAFVGWARREATAAEVAGFGRMLDVLSERLRR